MRGVKIKRRNRRGDRSEEGSKRKIKTEEQKYIRRENVKFLKRKRRKKN